MTPHEVLEAARVSAAAQIFVLGCFEQRVTVYSQQVRAINLVDAMLSEEIIRPQGGKVAIVGGGVAGMTAAVAFAKGAPDLVRIDLFESRSRVLQLQRSSQRFLHPHFYDWPAPESAQSNAGLPIMNWEAGSAGDVARALIGQFDEALRSTPLQVVANCEVVGLNPSQLGPVRVVTRDGPATDRIYDAVVLAIGFGIERFLGQETSSYWTPSELSAPILADVQAPLLFISGNGDGGLVDFVMAALHGYEHREICEWLSNLDLGPALVELETIENEAWAVGADLDLLAEYRDRLRHRIPNAAWAAVRERLRPNVRIVLHTNEQRLFRRTTALHNRLTTFLVLEADADDVLGPKAISVKVGVPFVGAPPSTGPVRLVGEPDLQPFKRVLRLGPDADRNITPFATLLAQYRANAVAAQPANRPTSPTLTQDAAARFDPFRAGPGAAEAAVVPQPAVAAPQATRSVVVTRVGADRVAWAGDLAPPTIEGSWAVGTSLEFFCDIDAPDAARLLPVLARLAAHANHFTLRVRDVARWHAALDRLWSTQSHPGPNLDFRCPIKDWGEPPALDAHGEMLTSELADLIHVRLDFGTLNVVHEALFNFLGPPAVATGWVIEAALRERLWILWQQWRASLTPDAAKQRRFLRLLASVHDRVDVEDAALVGIGPKIANRHLAMPTIFALAFAECSGLPVAPAGQHPGNIVSDALTGHSCGAEWIDQRAIRGAAAGQHGWTTSVVLLSELREAALLMEGNLRFDQVPSDPPRVGVAALSERPIVIGADGCFLSALEEGAIAMRRFFETIFRNRATASRNSLEGVADA